MKRLVILDFDDTLFDTYSFYHDIIGHLGQAYGLVADAFWEAAHQHRHESHGYDFIGHLNQHVNVTSNQLHHQIKGKLPKASYLFADAVSTLKRLQQAQVEIVILTVGLPAWQEVKFDHAPEIADIPRVVIAQHKGVYLKSRITRTTRGIVLPFGKAAYTRVQLIDDNIVNFEGLEQRPTQFELIRLRRPHSRRATIATPSDITEITSLDELN